MADPTEPTPEEKRTAQVLSELMAHSRRGFIVYVAMDAVAEEHSTHTHMGHEASLIVSNVDPMLVIGYMESVKARVLGGQHVEPGSRYGMGQP